MLKEMYDKSKLCNHIDNELYTTYKVKKGLRNSDGTGVCVGLTKIADVVGYIYDSQGINKMQKEIYYIVAEVFMK